MGYVDSVFNNQGQPIKILYLLDIYDPLSCSNPDYTRGHRPLIVVDVGKTLANCEPRRLNAIPTIHQVIITEAVAAKAKLASEMEKQLVEF